MHSRLLSNSSSEPPSLSPDIPTDTVSSSTSSSSKFSDMWNYLWIPFLITLSKELALARAQSSILLPGQLSASGDDSVTDSLSSHVPRCPVPPKLNYRPVIGILSHPGDGASGRLRNVTSASYIAASYVKFVESAGARVIPLIYNEPREVLFEVAEISFSSFFFQWKQAGRSFSRDLTLFSVHFPGGDLYVDSFSPEI